MVKHQSSKYSLPAIVIGAILLIGYIFMLATVLLGSNQVASIEQSLKLIDLQSEVVKLRGHASSDTAISVTTISTQAPLSVYKVNPASIRPGVIVLGMHRSGTSILGGLVNKMGFETGGPLIRPAEDNEKGFFERIDVVLENDELMSKQGVQYGWKTHMFERKLAVQHIMSNQVPFVEGKRGLEFLNNPSNYPWMLKDPRLCITLRAWLPLLNFYPAILFSYRHPMDVALSLHTRYA